MAKFIISVPVYTLILIKDGNSINNGEYITEMPSPSLDSLYIERFEHKNLQILNLSWLMKIEAKKLNQLCKKVRIIVVVVRRTIEKRLLEKVKNKVEGVYNFK